MCRLRHIKGAAPYLPSLLEAEPEWISSRHVALDDEDVVPLEVPNNCLYLLGRMTNRACKLVLISCKRCLAKAACSTSDVVQDTELDRTEVEELDHLEQVGRDLMWVAS